MTFFKIAWRNVQRNKRRSLITVSACAVGLTALIFIWSFVEGAHQQMIENYTSLMTSHLQIHRKGYHQNPKLEKDIVNPRDLLSSLNSHPQIEAASVRIKAQALASSAESSAGVMVLGIDPQEEMKVTHLHERIKKGAFLKSGQNNSIVIGDDLARNLNIDLGDKVVIMSQAFDGSIAAGSFRIAGILDTATEEIDRGLVLITYESAGELFVMPESASEIALKLSSSYASTLTAADLRKQFAAVDLPQELEILSWQEISPSFLQWIEFDNGFVWIIVVITIIVVAVGILNTILMGVLERTRELGVLMALGITPAKIVHMVLWESLILGLVGTFSGVILGVVLTYYFGHTGIDLTIVSKALNSLYIDSFIYPRLDAARASVTVAFVLVISVLAGLYPAWLATRLKPVEAIRNI